MSPSEPRKRILVVDDEAPIVEFLASRLKSWGYGVLTATNGDDCLAIAEQEQPDLILLDILMPKMNGREVFTRLRGRDRTKHIPVILLTALGMPEHIEAGFRMEPDDYIVKPFEPADLKHRIQTCLVRRIDGEANRDDV